jgi:tetrahydromethanopterin S-methyltransferase subunit G
MARSSTRRNIAVDGRVELLEDDVDRLEMADGSAESRIMARIDKLETHVNQKFEETNQRVSRLLITAVGLLGSVTVGIVVAVISLIGG